MSYTIREAAKATGRSKATIHRAVQSSKISAAKDDATGEWRIDPAELHRVFPAVSPRQNQPADLRHSETGDETEVLRVQLEQERTERQRERIQLEGTINDLRHRLDDEAAERRRLTAILTDQRAQAIDVPPTETPPATSLKRRWWQWR